MAKPIPTKANIIAYWRNEKIKNRKVYLDSVGEVYYTLMAEDAISKYNLDTPNGDSEIENLIFDWAVDQEVIVPIKSN